MEKCGPTVSLVRFRKDVLNRSATCAALGEDDPRYLPIGEAATRSQDAIDVRAAEVRQAEDFLVRARVLERARKLLAAGRYAQARLDLAAEAQTIYRTLLPTAPSALREAGITRAVALVESAVENLKQPATPESVRAEHLPVLQRELERMRRADTDEDRIRANLAAVRAALVVFKAERETERVSQYAMLLDLLKDRPVVNDSSCPRREGRGPRGGGRGRGRAGDGAPQPMGAHERIPCRA